MSQKLYARGFSPVWISMYRLRCIGHKHYMHDDFHQCGLECVV